LVSGGLAATLVLLATATQGASPSTAGQFRRTVDPSERAAYGTDRLTVKGATQTVQVRIDQLAEESFALFVSDAPGSFVTGGLVRLVAQLDRTSEKKGRWERKLVGTGGAPPQFDAIEDLSDLDGHWLAIAKPGASNLLVGVTNVVNGVTNVVLGLPATATGPTTGDVYAVLWAPVDALLTKNTFKFSGQTFMQLPESPRPSPDGKGKIKTKFTAKQGRSLFYLAVKGLLRGQIYSVWIGDAVEPALYIKAGEIQLKGSGDKGSFVRDTRWGDPLPQQARDVTDLSGRPVLILDEFEDVHLVGVVP